MMLKNKINKRPNVPAALPVAWAYIAARGKDPLLETTASKSLMAYRMAIA